MSNQKITEELNSGQGSSINLQELLTKDIKDAKNRIESIKLRMTQIQQMQSNIDLIIKRFEHKSIFDKVSLWYWDKPFYEKGVLGLLKAGFIGLGFAIQLTATAILLLGLVIGVFSLLSEHGKIFREREDRVCHDLEDMEQNLASELSELLALENKLNDSLILINQEMIDLNNKNATLKISESQLISKNKDLSKALDDLVDVKKRLEKSTEILGSEIKELTQKLSFSNKDIASKNQEISKLNKELQGLNERLKLSTKNLDNIQLNYINRIENLKKLEEELSDGIHVLKNLGGESVKPSIHKNHALEQGEQILKKAYQVLGEAPLSTACDDIKTDDLSFEEVMKRANQALDMKRKTEITETACSHRLH